MKEGDKVIMLEDYHKFKDCNEVTCIKVSDDGIHYFENKSGVVYCINSSRYKLKQEPMNKRQKLEKAAKDIQAQIDALPKNELGWYKEDDSKALFCVTEFLKNNWVKVYGFDCEGDWMIDNAQTLMGDSLTPLTKAEHKTLLEPALIAEAKRRYNEGDFVESVYDKHYSGNIKSNFYSEQIDEIWINAGNYNVQLLENGVWAKPIKSKVIINGLEMKHEGYKIVFGCMKFSKSNVKALYANCKRLNVSSVNIGGHTMVTLQQLSEIVKNIEA